MSRCSSDDVVGDPAQTGAAQPSRPERTKMGTPFPWLPMVAIAICLVTVAYALCNLFPYVGYMVQHLGVTDDKDEAGFYAGYLSSAFMVGRFGGSYFWGRVGDRYGRLPVMYMGLCSIALLSVGFGLSTTFFWAVACRFLLGALNGLVGTAKTMISEVCGSQHELVGMSFVTGCWSVGLVLGSGLGGLLAEPANRYPAVFPESGLFGRFPYLLPNVLGASLALIGLPLVYFFLEETLDVRKGGDRRVFEPIPTTEAEMHSQEATAEKGGGVEMTPLDNADDLQFASGGRGRATAGSGGETEPVTVGDSGGFKSSNVQARANDRLPLIQQRLRSPSRARELEGAELRSVNDGACGYARSTRDSIGEDEGVDAGSGESREGRRRIAFLRECLLPMKLLEEKRVRTVMFVYALFSLLNIGFDEAYPLWAISSVGSGGLDWTIQEVGQVLAVCGGGMLIFQLLVFPRIVKRIGPTRSNRWACCAAIPVVLAFPFLSKLHDSGGVLMAASLVLLFFTNIAANTMCINFSLAINSAVDPSQRGTLNGLSMMLGSLATAVGPTVFSTIFAWSINRRRPFPLDRHLVFCLFALGMVVVTATSWNVVISPVESEPPMGSGASTVVVAEEVAGGVEEEGLITGE